MTDPYQPFRMTAIWPVLVGCIAFYAVVFIASVLDGRLTRWRVGLAAVTGLMAAIVARSIAHAWDNSLSYWLAFTLGLIFATAVLLAHVISMILGAEDYP